MDPASPNPESMPAHVEQTVRSITLLHAKHHQDASQAQRSLDRLTAFAQKVAKVIELVEELRRDSPEVRNRVDSEAHEMSVRSDPHAVLGAIKAIDSEMRADAEGEGPAV